MPKQIMFKELPNNARKQTQKQIVAGEIVCILVDSIDLSAEKWIIKYPDFQAVTGIKPSNYASGWFDLENIIQYIASKYNVHIEKA